MLIILYSKECDGCNKEHVVGKLVSETNIKEILSNLPHVLELSLFFTLTQAFS